MTAVRELRSAGGQSLWVMAILATMPGLPKSSAVEGIDVIEMASSAVFVLERRL